MHCQFWYHWPFGSAKVMNTDGVPQSGVDGRAWAGLTGPNIFLVKLFPFFFFFSSSF